MKKTITEKCPNCLKTHQYEFETQLDHNFIVIQCKTCKVDITIKKGWYK